jgi:hypothetical protein
MTQPIPVTTLVALKAVMPAFRTTLIEGIHKIAVHSPFRFFYHLLMKIQVDIQRAYAKQ